MVAEGTLQSRLDAVSAGIVKDYGTAPSYSEILRLLDDRRHVPYRVLLSYNDEPLQPGEFGFMLALKEGEPSEGFVLYLHPGLRQRPEDAVPLIAYQLVVLYGPNEVTSRDAERFGARLMGMSEPEYYQHVCALADSLPPVTASE